ncbi:MAG: DUF4962 domain-containing protein, partial [Planctomycetes bacterium]|nr:DUF4962 domain-containing protein [Planctomycetota bacterium]
TRQLFAAITRGKTPRLAASYAVYLGDQPLQPAEVGVFRDEKLAGVGTTRRAALEMDFQRAYRLSAKAEQATADNPVTISARLLGAPGEPIAAMTLDRPGEKEVDFTAVTQWAGKRQAFTLEVLQPKGARLAALVLEPAGLPPLELESPPDGMRLTDLATFFRWKQVKGAIDYELQMAQDAQFTAAKTLTVRSEVEWPYYLPAERELPTPGTWFWRVRAVEPGRPGAWSKPRRMEVNNDHTKKPVKLVISPERPLFTIEACRVKDLSKFIRTIPEDLKPYVAFNCHARFNFIEYLKPLHEAGQMAFVRTHGPGPMSYWIPLADLEAVFQAYPNVIGIMGDETLS